MILCPKPVLVIAPMPVSLAVAISINPPTEEVLYQEPRRPFFCSAQLGDDSVDCVASVSSHPQVSRVPSREEITNLMK